MAHYTPKTNDTVSIKGQGLIRYVIVRVNAKQRTANVKNASGVIAVTRGIPWAALSRLDESQNAVRIVRETTENQTAPLP